MDSELVESLATLPHELLQTQGVAKFRTDAKFRQMKGTKGRFVGEEVPGTRPDEQAIDSIFAEFDEELKSQV